LIKCETQTSGDCTNSKPTYTFVPQKRGKNKGHLIPYHLKLLFLCSLDYVLTFCMDGKASKRVSQTDNDILIYF